VQLAAYVKDQLGHSSIRMTVDTYGYLVPGAKRQAVTNLPSLDATEDRAEQTIELRLAKHQK
jgi:hypothetical protein